jgi:hypothetical protein
MEAWEERLWADLEAQSDTEQIITVGEWITYITQVLQPKLGRHRRLTVVKLLQDPEWDAARLAETIGARTGTIKRLAEDGRAVIREEHRREEAAA